MRCTWRVDGYDAVNIGSNIAARYSASIGDVCEDAITVLGPGRRLLLDFARDLVTNKSDFAPKPKAIKIAYPRLTPSICKSIHHMPGIPRISHSAAFLAKLPSDSQLKAIK